MPSDDEVAEKFESQEMIFSQHAVDEAMQIEEVLNRAYEIRRAHGGLFGYDLEDWLQAERELAERNRTAELRFDGASHAGPKPEDQERNCYQCFGLDN